MSSSRRSWRLARSCRNGRSPAPPATTFSHRRTGFSWIKRNEAALNSVYERFTRGRARFRDLAYQGKELVLRVSMASELNVLAHALNRFSERSRYLRDFTLNSLTHAIREIIACFPVYRTYVNATRAGQRARPRVHRARDARGQASEPASAGGRSSTSSAICSSSAPTTSATPNARSRCASSASSSR